MGKYLAVPFWNLMVKCVFKFIRNVPCCAKWLRLLHFYPQCMRIQLVLHPRQHLVLVTVYNVRHPNMCGGVLLWFYLQLSNA